MGLFDRGIFDFDEDRKTDGWVLGVKRYTKI